MILEQDASGTTTQQALDYSLAADAVDPLLLHIYLNTPTDPTIAQVLWVATEGRLPWVKGGDNTDFRFIEHAVMPKDGVIEYRVFIEALDTEIQFLRHQRTAADWNIDYSVIDRLPPGFFRVEAHVQVPGRPTQVLKQSVSVLIDPENLNPQEQVPDGGEVSAFFIDKPLVYFTDSDDDIKFGVNNLPDGGDVLVISWSEEQGKLVTDFPHVLKQGPWEISAKMLDLLPTGMNELQLLVRKEGILYKATHRVLIVDPAQGIPDGGAGGGNGAIGGGDGAPDPGPDFAGVPAGFTKLNKSSETKVIYVSNSQGSDTNDGLTEQTPVKTLAKGTKLVRDGKPDWLLLKAGDTWANENIADFNISGAGPDAPAVLGVYGQGPRPLIIPPDGEHGVVLSSNKIKGIVVQGLHIYAATRDPGSPRFISRNAEANGIDLRLSGREGNYANSVIIEDCKVTHFDTNIKVVDDWARQQKDGEGNEIAGAPGRAKVTIRRNIVRYASGDDSHSVGIYLEGTRDSVIEQNLLDHNGWAQTDGLEKRNKRSHNIYAQSFNGPMSVRHNIIARGAANGLQLRAGGDVEHNLFVRNALAFWVSINDSKANYNVILESDDMNPDVGDKWRGMGIQGWAMDNFEVVGNVIARRVGTLPRPGLELHAGRLVVKDNRIYDWYNPQQASSMELDSPNLIKSNNLAKELGGNEPDYVDPSRGVETYAGTVGIEPTLEAFLHAVANRDRGQWVEELAPDVVCNYIRAGFRTNP